MHIITAENLVFGIAFLFMSFVEDRSNVQLAAWMIAVVLIVRLIVIVGLTAIHDASAVADTLIDSIAIVVYVALIVIGTRKKK